jgi:hypothetical protein
VVLPVMSARRIIEHRRAGRVLEARRRSATTQQVHRRAQFSRAPRIAIATSSPGAIVDAVVPLGICHGCPHYMRALSLPIGWSRDSSREAAMTSMLSVRTRYDKQIPR